MNIQIKNRWTGAIIHEGDYASLYEAVAGAIKEKANLRDANLHGADFRGSNLHGANLYDADLRGADLRDANLYGADLRDANLYGADLRGADLYGADLRDADLHGANLYDADLRGADLRDANLYGADLRGADLYGADLRDADFRGSNLYGAKNAELAIAKTRILPEGEIIGWKKLSGGAIAKLRIPESAKRSHAFGRKCRCSEAVVIAIFDGENKVAEGFSTHDNSFKYEVGEIVRPKESFSDDWQNECASGIHFFITREEAQDY